MLRLAKSSIRPQLMHSKASSQRRTIFGLFKRKRYIPLYPELEFPVVPGPPLLERDNLFHVLTESPIAEMRALGERIAAIGRCPVSGEQGVKFSCPECGYPSHKSITEWENDPDWLTEYAPRLRESNEDLHDLRSKRAFPEFTLPTNQPREQLVNFNSWDTLLFTRDFPAINELQSIRHVSQLITYPMTIAAVLSETGPFTKAASRLTKDGNRSMAALRHTIFSPILLNSPPKPPIRIFLPGARAESTLPVHIWSQLAYIMPLARFELYMVGPEVVIPETHVNNEAGTAISIGVEKNRFGVPSHRRAIDRQTTVFTIQAQWEDVHDILGPFDPYTDVVFMMHPGLGFPSQRNLLKSHSDESIPDTGSNVPGLSALQISHEWSPAFSKLLSSHMAIFMTSFSPADMSRDASAIIKCEDEGVEGEWDWVMHPGQNPFGSLRWSALEEDIRVAIRSNWGIMGVRGKRYDLVEGSQEEPRTERSRIEA